REPVAGPQAQPGPGEKRRRMAGAPERPTVAPPGKGETFPSASRDSMVAGPAQAPATVAMADVEKASRSAAAGTIVSVCRASVSGACVAVTSAGPAFGLDR